MLMYVPATTPVKAGDSLRVTLGSVARPEFAELNYHPMDAAIVRVDRKPLTSLGQLAIGVRFMQA